MAQIAPCKKPTFSQVQVKALFPDFSVKSFFSSQWSRNSYFFDGDIYHVFHTLQTIFFEASLLRSVCLRFIYALLRSFMLYFIPRKERRQVPYFDISGVDSLGVEDFSYRYSALEKRVGAVFGGGLYPFSFRSRVIFTRPSSQPLSVKVHQLQDWL